MREYRSTAICQKLKKKSILKFMPYNVKLTKQQHFFHRVKRKQVPFKLPFLSLHSRHMEQLLKEINVQHPVPWITTALKINRRTCQLKTYISFEHAFCAGYTCYLLDSGMFSEQLFKKKKAILGHYTLKSIQDNVKGNHHPHPCK